MQIVCYHKSPWQITVTKPIPIYTCCPPPPPARSGRKRFVSREISTYRTVPFSATPGSTDQSLAYGCCPTLPRASVPLPVVAGPTCRRTSRHCRPISSDNVRSNKPPGVSCRASGLAVTYPVTLATLSGPILYERHFRIKHSTPLDAVGVCTRHVN
jgi:hypothetical protein